MERILVPLDGSEFAESALAAALDLARACRAELHLVQVHEYVLPFPREETLLDDDAPFAYTVAETGPAGDPAAADTALEAELHEQVRREDAGRLEVLAAECASRAGLRTRTELLDGPVVPTLARYIRDAGIDVVVMTTHGRGGISRVWLGSVADALVRQTHVPVLLLRPTLPGAPRQGLDRIRRVLVPLDGSPLAEQMLEPAAALARAFDAGVTLLHAVPPYRPNARTALRQGEGLLSTDLQHIERYLESQAAGLREKDLRTGLSLSIHASPALAIIEAAAARDDTLIALATHGRGGWARVALGSVADKVLRAAAVPVLLYRPPVPPARQPLAAAGANTEDADAPA